MDKIEIYAYLNKKNIKYEVTNHEAVYTMEELSNIYIPYSGGDAKNLFLKDDKKKTYYLITVKGNKRVDLKEFRNKNNTRSLSFASSTELFNKMKLMPGSVTSLGLLNNVDKDIIYFIDRYFFDSNIIGIHPNDNTATIWLNPNDLIEIIKEHGNQVNIVEI